MTDEQIQSTTEYHNDIIKVLDIPDNLIDDARQELWIATLGNSNPTQHLQHWLKHEKRHIYHND